MKHILLFEKFVENDLLGRIVKFSDLDSYEIPIEIKEMMKTWDVIYKSPYSDSFYSSSKINTGYVPSGTYRVSDHWNFRRRGRKKKSCVTDTNVPNVGYVSIARYSLEKKLYEIILSIPTERTIKAINKKEAKLKYLKDPETIWIKKQFKERIKNKEILININYDGINYDGIVRKFTDMELKIENENGDLIFNDNYLNSSKIKSLRLYDINGGKIDCPFDRYKNKKYLEFIE